MSMKEEGNVCVCRTMCDDEGMKCTVCGEIALHGNDISRYSFGSTSDHSLVVTAVGDDVQSLFFAGQSSYCRVSQL